MRIYETTFILSPQADDAAFDRQIKSVTELITRKEGKILNEDRWGIRRLAYPIKKFTQGFYTRLVFEGNNELLTEMDRLFRLEEPYIRHLTVQFEGSLEKPAPKPHHIPRGRREDSRPYGRKPVETAPFEKPPVEKETVPEPPAAPKPEVKPEPKPEPEKPAETAEPTETEKNDKTVDPTENEL